MTTPPYTFAITGHHTSEKNLVFNAGRLLNPSVSKAETTVLVGKAQKRMACITAISAVQE